MFSILPRNWLYFLLVFLIIFVLSFLSFGQALNLNFYHDDFASLYFIQNGMNFPYPYYTNFIFWPFYRFFGLNPMPYYLGGLILFSLAGFLTTILSYLLFPKKITALVACLFFVFSFIGSENMYSMNQAIAMNFYVTLALTTLISHLIFLRKRKPFFLYFSIFFFTIATALFPYRVYTLIMFLYVLEIFFIKRIEGFKKAILRLSIFTSIAAVFFLLLPFLLKSLIGLSNVRQFSVLDIALNLFKWQKYPDFSVTFLNLFLPNTLHSPETSFNTFFITPYPAIAFFVIYVLFLFYIKNKKLWMLTMWIMIGWTGFAMVINIGPIQTLDRYMIMLRAFSAILFSGIIFCVFFKQKNKFLSLFVSIVFIVIFVFQITEHFKFQNGEVKVKGYQAKSALSVIMKAVPRLDNNTVFYFGGEDYYLGNELSDVFRVGFLPHTTSLAVYYKTDYNRIGMVGSGCSDLKDALNRFAGKKTDLYYFIKTFETTVVQENSKKLREKCRI